MRRALPLLVLAVLGLAAWLAFRPGGFLAGSSADGAAGEDTIAPEAAESGGGLAGGARRKDPAEDPKTFEGDPVSRVDAGLGSATVVGRVVADGQPLRFARVVPVLPAPASAAVRTGRDGRFEVAGLPAGDLDLRVSADGHLSRTVRTPALAAGGKADLGDVALRVRPERKDGLEVKVVDDAGRPIPGARVTASTLYLSLLVTTGARSGVPDTTTLERRTDDLGVARFEALVPETYSVAVRAADYTFEGLDNVVVASGRVEHVSVALKRAMSIAGSVVDPDGGPVAGAYVTGLLMPGFRQFEAVQTDTGGRFTLGGLLPGDYMVVTGSEGRGEAMAPKVRAGEGALRLQLGGAGTLKGRVLLADGKPATRFTLRPYTGDWFRYTYSRLIEVSDPDGRFSIGLSPAAYQLDVRGEGGAFTTAKVTVKKDETSELEVRLPPSGAVAGVVTDADGTHLDGAEVFVKRGGFPPEPVREQYTRTDGDGHFVLRNLPLESVKLHVRRTGFATKEVMATPVAEGTGSELTVRLGLGARVVGRVTRKEGKPVAGERLNLSQGFDFLASRTTFSGDDGSFRFPAVAAGAWTVSNGRFENASRGQRKNVTVGDEGEVVVDFQVEGDLDAIGVIQGRVLVAGAPAAKATVYVQDDRGAAASVTTETDAEGRYVARGIRPGRATVYVETGTGLSDTEGASVPTSGEPVTVDFSFGSAGLRVVLVGGDGKTPVSGAWLTVETQDVREGASAWEGVRAQLNSNERGVVVAAGLPPGTYRLRIVGTGFAAKVTDPFAVGDGETKDLGTLRLQPGGSISGRVTDEAGNPVEGVGVSVKNARGEDVFLFNIASTGSNGRYEMQGIEVGEYTVKFEGKGYAPVTRSVAVTEKGMAVDAVMRRGGSLVVRVEDERGQPVEGARVVLYDAAGKRVERTLSIVNLFDADVTKIGASGTTTIPDLAAGGYKVGATKDGFTLVGDPASVTLDAGGQPRVVLVLRAGS